MGDWDDDDWEADNLKLPTGPAVASSKPNAEADKFAGEDADLGTAEPKHHVPVSQPKKKEEQTWEAKRGEVEQELDTPLDDPLAEKARQQKLVEQADFAEAKALFAEVEQLNLDMCLPKSLKEFEDYAQAIASRYVVIHKDSKTYKGFLKALFKASLVPLSATDCKDVETAVAQSRSDKHKAELAEAAAKKGTKKSLNLGKGSGNTAGLDDYKYNDAGQDDDHDFM
mmetsp:Transcript_16563/g.28392  ORF Transcript_16563/g.28392 Transcript_16563/m.28392 type:complete len:226 (-) Transcript_16563:933-1610(-)|eukprot:CAMPEP_0119103092 /NCGR_PEP_ID=MMETSP1180-20130426/1631_1 /TAXON_ID=3052 ORGANISM="Chlamydomonas cf sp, Strain CCMP681" /NCGR_SAMPLE_ID=MMETSP1180 /ASSEMBLY_ACC=CAM_ASM_000741 /LENGTH=225 /DNA_ID=CAMNT_0007087525 /DNA_START=95 /DNA_END=772 /DNA_ORIENTATION=+